MACWLMKSEPGAYSIDDLERDGVTCWEGVRNYQARNFMRDEMKVGDQVLFYHSSAKPAGVAGIAKVVKAAYPDHFAQDSSSKYFDPKATPDKPIWMMVDVAFVAKFREVVSLQTLKAEGPLEGMLVVKKGQRLSVQPCSPEHYDHVVKLARM